MEDIRQNIELNYNTNAETTAKEVEVLANSVDNVTDSQDKNTASTKKNEQSMSSFKTQLRQANQELLKVSQTYGETSQEAVKAAKKVAELKDQMAFAKDLVDKFNPDQKMKALTAATSLAGTAMTGVVSGMALFGDQSDDTAKALLKVQSALAFSQAISGLSEVGDQFKTLKTTIVSAYIGITTAKTADTVATEANAVAENQSFLAKAKNVVVNGALSIATGIATAAQWAWNAAMAANPIGAIVAVVVALIAAGYALVKMFQASSAEAEAAAAANAKLGSEMRNLEKSTAKSNEEMDMAHKRSLALAKAHGASSDAIRKLSLSLVNQEIKEKALNAEKARSIFLEAQRIAMSEDATDAQKKTAQEAYKLFQSQNDTLKESLKNRKQITIDNEVEIAQEKTDAQNKEKENKKKHNEDLAKIAEDKRKKDAEAKEKERKAHDDFLNSIPNLETNKLKELQDINAKTEQEKLDLQEQRDLSEIMAIEKKGGDISNLMALHNEKYTVLNEELDQKEKERLAKVSEDRLNALMEELDADVNAQEEKKNKELKIDKTLADQKKANQDQLVSSGEQLIKNIQNLAGKNKAIQKAAIIAEGGISVGKAIANTSEAVTKDLAKGMPFSIPLVALDVAVGATSVASIIKGTSQALQAVGGGSAPTGSVGSVGTSASPQMSFQTSKENQIATSLGGKLNEQPPIKAYVTTGDVATGLLLHNKAVSENSIGG
jgi:hypothetical protein